MQRLRFWSLCLIALIGSSCAKASWVTYPNPTPPDRACRIGVEAVTDYYLWDCLNEEHVVIYQFGSFWGPREAKKEVSKCGEKTAIEQKENLPESCEAPSASFEWNAPVNKRGKISR